jgi:RNA polymerase sigma factor (sigma-70 family)
MSGASGTESADADSPDVTAQEAQLARRAAEGDGVAFATLYDRYEQRVFTFCQRITGSAEDAADATQEAFVAVLERLPKLTDRDLNFAAYLFTTARHAAYRVIDKRRKAEPVDEIPDRGASGGGFGGGFEPDGDPDEDPERRALAGGQQEQIRAAHARLPERQREVLVLRELEELSYDDIAEIMDMNRNSVAQLISRARINLRDELRGEALASIAATSPDCEKALPLIAMRDDGQLADPLDAAWLEQHVGGCERCRAAIEAMHEAGISYRALAPAAAFVWLRNETIAKAAERMGFDWSDVPARSSGDGSSGASGGAGGGAGAAAGAGGGAGDAMADAGANGSGGVLARARSFVHERRRRAAVLGGLLLLLLLGGATAIAVGGRDTPTTPATDKPAAGTSPITEAGGTGGDPSTTDGGTSGKDKSKGKGDANTPIPVVGTTTTSGTPKKGKKATQTTTIAGLPVRHPRTHKPKRTHTPTKHPKHHTPKPTGGGSTPTPAPTPDPTPTNDTPPQTPTQDNPPPATTNTPPTTTAIAGPPPSTTPTQTQPCRPSATGRPCP